MPNQSAARTAIVYLARKAEGLAPFQRFREAYKKFCPSVDHDLVVIFKGFEAGDPLLAEARQVFAEIPIRELFIDDQGIDITSYLDASKRLEHEELCFLNTFSEPDDADWLGKLIVYLRRPGVGIVGATGSYESLQSSMDLLSKVVWLCAARKVPFDERIAKHYRWLLETQIPTWLETARRSSIGQRLRHLFVRLDDYRHHDDAYQRHWEAVTQRNGPIEWAPLFPPFPNPHVRSNCFAIDRQRFVSLGFTKIITKMEGCQFESGTESLTARLRASGLAALVVGKDGLAYDIANWPRSRTFRLGNQDNVLVTDNQTRNFRDYSPEERATHVLLSWGNYVEGGAANVPKLGKRFERALKPL